jgi:hypothetical protein
VLKNPKWTNHEQLGFMKMCCPFSYFTIEYFCFEM